MFFHREAPTQDAGPLTPLERWFQAMTGHFCFSICTSLLLFLSLVPMILCICGFLRTGALIFVLGWVIANGMFGPVFTAMQRAAWELQFGVLYYPARDLLRWLRESLRQGAILGIFSAFLWTLLLSPLWLFTAGGPPLPLWLIALLAVSAVVLSTAEGYAFYQAARWDLRCRDLCRNSLLLLFAAGWQSFLSGLVWLILPVGLIFWYPIMLPLSIIAGLPMIISITAQAIFSPSIDELMDLHQEEKAK